MILISCVDNWDVAVSVVVCPRQTDAAQTVVQPRTAIRVSREIPIL
jgi:hypothetical protein